MVAPRIVWLGQDGEDVLPLVVAPTTSKDGWTRSEKILLLGVLINATFLALALSRSPRGQQNPAAWSSDY